MDMLTVNNSYILIVFSGDAPFEPEICFAGPVQVTSNWD